MNLPSMRLEMRAAVAHLTFTQGERGNPIDGAFCADIRAVSIELAARPAVRAILVTAEGRSFSVGGDINAFTADLDALPAKVTGWAGDLHDGIARLQRLNAPMVAAVHGVCAGGMTAFVAGADVVLASDKARFVSAYTGIGYSCDAGASIMLSRRLGHARAKRFLLLGEALDAQAALAAGLADEVTAAEDLAARAGALAARLAAGPSFAYGEIKRLFQTVDHQPLEAQLALEAASIARSAATADARAALTAFSNKERPTFAGR
ncbi:enoyl-CoA hydratase/isomerase family protein [Zavarzinia compransoris]|nr:enoyl-CoA hydratase/isomerase family protein [Zavarzinia compransoris]TDP43957.1 2-(1,2-epoxy-1,2-dihydrophenyl)acetyl-CoA isomerase [Zavarzinia compransoris]